jgi:hypothetical protein
VIRGRLRIGGRCARTGSRTASSHSSSRAGGRRSSVQRGAGDRISRRQAVQLGRRAIRQARSFSGELKSHAPDRKLSVAGLDVNVTAAVRSVVDNTALGGRSPEDAFVRNALSDAVNLPKDSVLATYQMGAAALDLTHGNTEQAKRVVRGPVGGRDRERGPR